MSCQSSPGLSRTQFAPANTLVSDAFGSGCTSGCGYPLDCGNQYPQFQYYAEVMGNCVYQPAYATSSLHTPVCQVCEKNLSGCMDNIPTPQSVVMAAGRPKSSC